MVDGVVEPITWATAWTAPITWAADAQADVVAMILALSLGLMANLILLASISSRSSTTSWI